MRSHSYTAYAPMQAQSVLSACHACRLWQQELNCGFTAKDNDTQVERVMQIFKTMLGRWGDGLAMFLELDLHCNSKSRHAPSPFSSTVFNTAFALPQG